MKSLAASLSLFFCAAAQAATSGQALTPTNVSVLGSETKTFSVRFTDAAGRPAVGETVQFVNDACGWFANNSAVANVRTDANGVASTTFTAYNQGITCWLIAVATPAQVQFNVLTYTKAQVYMTAALDPLKPRPGQPFRITSSVMAGAYKLYDQDMSVRVVPGNASAAISPGSANTGEGGSVVFDVAPDAHVGDYDIEFNWRGFTQRLPMKAPPNPFKDMWWGGLGENGWGVSIVQHGDTLFNVLYAYDTAGKPTWLVMPGGAWNEGRTAFEGALYRPHGAPFSAYDPTKFGPGESVGSAKLSVMDGNNLMLDYTIDGVAGHKRITRQAFAPQDPAALSSDYADMWWGGAGQNGWGIAWLQQYRTLFGVWFTYDATGAPTWFVMPSGAWTDATTYQGRLYRTTGSPWLGVPYDPSLFRTTDAGPFSIRFADDGHATLGYTVDGHAGTLTLSRQPF